MVVRKRHYLMRMQDKSFISFTERGNKSEGRIEQLTCFLAYRIYVLLLLCRLCRLCRLLTLSLYDVIDYTILLNIYIYIWISYHHDILITLMMISPKLLLKTYFIISASSHNTSSYQQASYFNVLITLLNRNVVSSFCLNLIITECLIAISYLHL